MAICVHLNKDGIMYKKMITFYIDLNDCDELDKLAREEERPRAYVIRQLLKEGLKRRSRGLKDESK